MEALNALPLRLGDELVVRVTVAEPASGRVRVRRVAPPAAAQDALADLAAALDIGTKSPGPPGPNRPLSA